MLERAEYIYSIPDGLTGEKNQDNIVPFINYKEAAPQRCLEMLLKKHRGEHFQSEVIMVSHEKRKNMSGVQYSGLRGIEARQI